MSAPSRVMKRTLSSVWGLALSAGCATSTTERLRLPPLQTVAHVALSRYVGTWYEIANFPQSFQCGCTATTATYTLRADGDIGLQDLPLRANLVRQKEADGGAPARALAAFDRNYRFRRPFASTTGGTLPDASR